MAEQNTQPQEGGNAEQQPQGQSQGQQPNAAPKAETTTPPWGSDEDFKPDKAWKLIQDLRADKDRLSARPVLSDEAKQKLDEYARLEEASKSELQRANEATNRWQTEADRWRTAAVSSRVQALAAADFADPSDAVGQLDPSHYIDAGGVIDDTAIQRDLNGILEKKPHWRRATEPASPRVPAPNRAQGTSGSANPGTSPRDQFAAILQGGLNRPQ